MNRTLTHQSPEDYEGSMLGFRKLNTEPSYKKPTLKCCRNG